MARAMSASTMSTLAPHCHQVSPRALRCVEVPRSAPPAERRIAYHTLLAHQLLGEGRSLLPTGEHLGAIEAAGLARGVTPERFATAYATTSAVAQATQWDAVPSSWTGAGGWKEKLGPAKTALVLGLRAMLQRNPSIGTSRRLLHLSAEQLSALAGVCPRTIYRWFARDELTLAELLAARDAEEPRADRLGRRLPSVYAERLERAYLHLFVQAWASTRRDTASGRVYTWKYWVDVLPTDPVSAEEFGEFLDALTATPTPSDDASSYTDMTSAGPCTDMTSALYTDTPSDTEGERASNLYPRTTRKTSGKDPEPDGASEWTLEGNGAASNTPTHLSLKDTPHSSAAHNIPDPTPPLPPLAPQASERPGQSGEWSPERSQAWSEAHHEEIGVYHRRIDHFVRRLTETWYDAAPVSTVTRCATLLVAGGVPPGDATAVLYAASDAAKRAHVAREGRRVPAFLWALQQLTIDEPHPAWWPRPSERGIVNPWGEANVIRARKGARHD